MSPMDPSNPGSIGQLDKPHGAARARGKPRSRFAFFREFIKAPVELGTCFASSKALSRTLVSGLGLEQARSVLELGPGTGALTAEILARVPAGCRVVAIERNAGLAEELRARYPSVHLHQDDARNLVEVCQKEGIAPCEIDVVVNSLPFLLFPPDLQDDLLRKVSQMLRPGGRFTLLTYRIEGLMPSVNRVKALMRNHFSKVELRARVLQNIPPASIYWCQK